MDVTMKPETSVDRLRRNIARCSRALAVAAMGLLLLAGCSDNSSSASSSTPEVDAGAYVVDDGGAANDSPVFWDPFKFWVLLDAPETFDALKSESVATVLGRFESLRPVGRSERDDVLVASARFRVTSVIAGELEDEVVDLHLAFADQATLDRAAEQVPPGDALLFLTENKGSTDAADGDPRHDPKIFPFYINGPFGLWARTGDQAVATPLTTELPGDRFHPFSNVVGSDATLRDVVDLVISE